MLIKAYPKKYDTLLDDEVREYINLVDAAYPPDTVGADIEQQRKLYDQMCQKWAVGYPDGVTSTDSTIESEDGYQVPVRIYQNQNPNSKAHVVYYHGGGFVVGGLDSHDDVCAEICGRTGFGVTAVDYRLAPEYGWPQDFQDALAAFMHVSKQFGGDVVVAGDSAGGTLAAAVSHSTKNQEHKPKKQVLIYPALGTNLTDKSFVEHAEAPVLTTKDTEYYLNIRGGVEENRSNPEYAPLSDTNFLGLPTTTVITAECDPLRDQGEQYYKKIQKSLGDDAEWFDEAGLVHGFLRARHTATKAQEAFDKIINSIASV